MKTQKVTLYIHTNLNAGIDSEKVILPFDATSMTHVDYVLMGTQEVDVTIPEANLNALAIAKFDANIERLRDVYHVAVAKEEAAKQEWLAIGVDV